MYLMSVSRNSIHNTSLVELMLLDDHDAVFNPVHAKKLVRLAWTAIVFVVLVTMFTLHYFAAPAFELYTQSVPGASSAMLSFLIAGFVGLVAVDLAANLIERHNASSRLAKVTAG